MKKLEEQFWVMNISNRNVSLSDLGLTIPAFKTVNLLDSKHYSLDKETLEASAESGSLYKKKSKIKKCKVIPDQQIYKSNLLEINTNAKTVKREGESIILTAKEFKLLYYLAKNTGRIVSRDQILDNVWDINFDMNTNVVDVYITYLRKKIDKPFATKLIHTMKGLGYVIKP